MAPLSLYWDFYSSYLRCSLNLALARLYTPQAPPQRDLTGQTAIVTGANSGIGLCIAVRLARQGATVYLACRNQAKGDEAVEYIKSQLGSSGKPANIFCWTLDVSDMASVRTFCTRWRTQGTPIDILVHNAGIPDVTSSQCRYNEKGLDVIYVTNLLGSFLMTSLLEPLLSPTSRTVFTSSISSYLARDTVLLPRPTRPDHSTSNVLIRAWHRLRAALGLRDSGALVYGQTKAHQILLSSLLQSHFDASYPNNKRTVHAFSPGFTQSPIFTKFDMTWRTLLYDPAFSFLYYTETVVATETDEGAKTGAWLAACGGESGVEGGKYWEVMKSEVSVIEYWRGKLGEERFKEVARGIWKVWEEDSGCEWDIKF
ncbi:hypothetical protein COCVIDRAFT_37932 [Bipolaris victoriae FI3]|uniref:NAD(P)-binding protein n=1 Tax=Bipolaris victoriae (strain FI3) TaxID=930091 RepID=W7EF61_BIPV3|nr:hypothetical protein COCVIDRAFT_37932 [Bipolaris victoriae FI3]